jgi:hypothetical protein
MSTRTVFLSRLIGLYCIIASLSMIIRGRATVLIVEELVRNAPLLFVVGTMTLAAGLAMVLSHNVWSGGALPIVVTVAGWASLIKGVLLLFLSPQEAPAFFLGELHYGQLFYLYAAISLILGAYLTFAGFRSTAR